jgi:glucokinase
MPKALKLYAELGTHIGHAIKQVMYAYDPQLIVLGGSVSARLTNISSKPCGRRCKTFAYTKGCRA